MGGGLNGVLINARSIMAHQRLEELSRLCKKRDLDIVGVVETWLHEGIGNGEINIQGYDVYRRDRDEIKEQRAGGIMLYVKKSIKSKICNFYQQFKCEGLLCELGEGGNSLYVGVFYRPPSAAVEETQEINRLIQRVADKNVLLIGDFNYPEIDWDQLTSDKESESFLQLTLDCFLFQQVKSPTRENNILDLILTSEERMVSKVELEEPLVKCDHRTVHFNLICNVNKITGKTCIKENRNFNRAKYGDINRELGNINWGEELNGLTVEEMWSRFLDIVKQCINKYVPTNNTNDVKYMCKNKPWYNNNEVKEAARAKQNTWNRYKQSKTQEDQDLYRIKLNKYTNVLRNAKRKYENDIATQAKTNCKPFFRYIRDKRVVKEGIGDLRDGDGNFKVGDLEKCNILNKHFSNCFNGGDYRIMPQVEVGEDGVKMPDIYLDEAQIRNKLAKLVGTKAGGVDGLPSRFLQETAGTICTPLYIIFNKSLATSRVPEDWKKSNVTAIFKSGEKTDPNNYRPVSLTCIVCKIFETILKERIVEFLDKNNIICTTQHGFRQGRSCLTNLLTFMEKVLEWSDEQEAVDVVYLDFRKAFDRVSHRLLLHKLEAYGVEGEVLRWIGAWLCGRTQRVVINGVASEWVEVTSGVPQGSVLGPVLFTVFINDLDEGIVSRLLKFADDTKAFGRVRNSEEAKILQDDLDRLVDWAEKWGMEFNTRKCKVMHIGRNNLLVDYSMRGEVLEVIEEEKDLGVLVSSDLKVGSQCVKASKVANRMLGLIKRCFCSRDRRVIVPLYKAMVRPHLEYCVQVWRPHLEKDKALLEAVQHRATKCIEGLWGLSYEERLEVLGLQTLEYRRLRGDLIEVFKMYKGWSGLRFEDFFIRSTTGLRGHDGKVFKVGFRTDLGKYRFCSRVIFFWNKLTVHVLDSSCINSFKNGLDGIMGKCWGLR